MPFAHTCRPYFDFAFSFCIKKTLTTGHETAAACLSPAHPQHCTGDTNPIGISTRGLIGIFLNLYRLNVGNWMLFSIHPAQKEIAGVNEELRTQVVTTCNDVGTQLWWVRLKSASTARNTLKHNTQTHHRRGLPQYSKGGFINAHSTQHTHTHTANKKGTVSDRKHTKGTG